MVKSWSPFQGERVEHSACHASVPGHASPAGNIVRQVRIGGAWFVHTPTAPYPSGWPSGR